VRPAEASLGVVWLVGPGCRVRVMGIEGFVRLAAGDCVGWQAFFTPPPARAARPTGSRLGMWMGKGAEARGKTDAIHRGGT
jgi:hypothetical protein